MFSVIGPVSFVGLVAFFLGGGGGGGGEGAILRERKGLHLFSRRSKSH